MIHYSWDSINKLFHIYLDKAKVGTMWWNKGELYFSNIEGVGYNSVVYKDIVKIMEHIEYDQFGK